MSANRRLGGWATSAERLTSRMDAIVPISPPRRQASQYNVAPWSARPPVPRRSMPPKAATAARLIAENRKARFDYFIEERYEAGLALQGWEVKAMRAGRAQLTEAYVYLRGGEAFLYRRAHLPAAHDLQPRRRRPRPHPQAAAASQPSSAGSIGAVERKGYTLVPLELYWKDGRAKLAGGPRQRQETARQARGREGPRLAARQGPIAQEAAERSRQIEAVHGHRRPRGGRSFGFLSS